MHGALAYLQRQPGDDCARALQMHWGVRNRNEVTGSYWGLDMFTVSRSLRWTLTHQGADEGCRATVAFGRSSEDAGRTHSPWSNHMVKHGLFALSEEWHRMRYRALKAETRLKELRTLLHAKYHNNSQIADSLLKLEVTLYGEDKP